MKILSMSGIHEVKMIVNYSKQAVKFLGKQDWENIEEVEPDSWDLQMLKEVQTNPECSEFVSEEDAMKELGLA